jgi:hypothetical protein
MDPRNERAQLWGIYFQLLGVSDPPPLLALARDELAEHLDVDRAGGHSGVVLRLIGGGRGRVRWQS